VIIPPAKAVPSRTTERLVIVNELDDLARNCFPVHSIYLLHRPKLIEDMLGVFVVE